MNPNLHKSLPVRCWRKNFPDARFHHLEQANAVMCKIPEQILRLIDSRNCVHSPKLLPAHSEQSELGRFSFGSPAPGMQLPRVKKLARALPKSQCPVKISPASLRTSRGIFQPFKLEIEPWHERFPRRSRMLLMPESFRTTATCN